jgi:hypothetical protein
MPTKWMNMSADGFLLKTIEQNNKSFFDAQIRDMQRNEFCFLIRNSRSFQKIAWEYGNLDYPSVKKNQIHR